MRPAGTLGGTRRKAAPVTGREKVSKASVHYRDAAEGAARRCASCSMFRRLVPWAADGRCTLVAGPIRGAGVCDRWEARR